MARHLSGAPQGGVVSPILSNIYLDRLETLSRRNSSRCTPEETRRASQTGY